MKIVFVKIDKFIGKFSKNKMNTTAKLRLETVRIVFMEIGEKKAQPTIRNGLKNVRVVLNFFIPTKPVVTQIRAARVCRAAWLSAPPVCRAVARPSAAPAVGQRAASSTATPSSARVSAGAGPPSCVDERRWSHAFDSRRRCSMALWRLSPDQINSETQ